MINEVELDDACRGYNSKEVRFECLLQMMML